jgi:hypothetical protein
MDQSMILYVAIAVFSLMVVGLAMTIWEFSRGEPHQQAETAQREQDSRHSGHGTQRT